VTSRRALVRILLTAAAGGTVMEGRLSSGPSARTVIVPVSDWVGRGTIECSFEELTTSTVSGATLYLLDRDRKEVFRVFRALRGSTGTRPGDKVVFTFNLDLDHAFIRCAFAKLVVC
jgi:hypothetical protein